MEQMQPILEAWKNTFGSSLISVVLFGSRARGDYKETSDYDLFVILENPPSNPWERVQMLRLACPKGHPPLNLVIYSPQEINRDIFPLLLDVAHDGIALWDQEGFFEERKRKIFNILEEAGLQRRTYKNEFSWQWQKPPKGHWELTWEGFRELP